LSFNVLIEVSRTYQRFWNAVAAPEMFMAILDLVAENYRSKPEQNHASYPMEGHRGITLGEDH
jgi:hypothetical protein